MAEIGRPASRWMDRPARPNPIPSPARAERNCGAYRLQQPELSGIRFERLDRAHQYQRVRPVARRLYLSDDPANLKKWAISTGITLSAGQRIAFDEVTGFHSPITNGFGLDKTGEQVLFSYAPNAGPASVIDFVQFKGQENGRTLGRYPDATGEWLACVPTPDTATSASAGAGDY
jgi:hypothetical protein